MTELTDTAIAAIVAHMNEDHADSVRDYARYFGALAAVESAVLQTFDSAGMAVVATVGGTTQRLAIPFDHPLRDTDDARETLVAMARAAASR